jgi:hypothetical protein
MPIVEHKYFVTGRNVYNQEYYFFCDGAIGHMWFCAQPRGFDWTLVVEVLNTKGIPMWAYLCLVTLDLEKERELTRDK